MQKIAINDATGCWEWVGYVRPDGYAQTTRRSVKDYVHRFAYREANGEIPDGFVIDHLCKVRHCCNPEHLEAVTQAVNCQRGDTGKALTELMRSRAASQTHCKHGHEFTPENTKIADGRRHCQVCRRDITRRYNLKRRGRPCRRPT